jgi:hypothetical protein
MSRSDEKSAYRQLGAQESCPCGSGEKYIDCCLDKNIRWLINEDGTTIKTQPFGGPQNNPVNSEDIDILRMTVEGGKISYAKNNQVSHFHTFPSDFLKMMLSVIEVQKSQALLEALNKSLCSHNDLVEDSSEELTDGTYIILLVSVDAETGYPVGIGGRSITNMLSETSLMTLIGAFEEIRTDVMLCLTVNSMMNGMLGAVDSNSN